MGNPLEWEGDPLEWEVGAPGEPWGALGPWPFFGPVLALFCQSTTEASPYFFWTLPYNGVPDLRNFGKIKD